MLKDLMIANVTEHLGDDILVAEFEIACQSTEMTQQELEDLYGILMRLQKLHKNKYKKLYNISKKKY